MHDPALALVELQSSPSRTLCRASVTGVWDLCGLLRFRPNFSSSISRVRGCGLTPVARRWLVPEPQADSARQKPEPAAESGLPWGVRARRAEGRHHGEGAGRGGFPRGAGTTDTPQQGTPPPPLRAPAAPRWAGPGRSAPPPPRRWRPALPNLSPPSGPAPPAAGTPLPPRVARASGRRRVLPPARVQGSGAPRSPVSTGRRPGEEAAGLRPLGRGRARCRARPSPPGRPHGSPSSPLFPPLPSPARAAPLRSGGGGSGAQRMSRPVPVASCGSGGCASRGGTAGPACPGGALSPGGGPGPGRSCGLAPGCGVGKRSLGPCLQRREGRLGRYWCGAQEQGGRFYVWELAKDPFVSSCDRSRQGPSWWPLWGEVCEEHRQFHCPAMLKRLREQWPNQRVLP